VRGRWTCSCDRTHATAGHRRRRPRGTDPVVNRNTPPTGCDDVDRTRATRHMADDSARRHHNRRQTPYQLKIASLSALPGPERKDETYAGRHTGATTAEKLEGTSGGVDDNLLSFLLHPFPVSRYCSTHVSPIPFPILLSFSPFKFSQVFGSTVSFLHCPAKKMAASCRSWRGPNTLGPRYLQGWTGRVPRVL